MKVLLIGYSNIAIRRILPALDSWGLERIDIATNHPDEVDTSPFITPCAIYSGYEEGINSSDAEFCYISTVNSAHFSHAKSSLMAGKHTVVDKPIAMKREEAEELVAISREKSCLLSEAVVYLDHIRIQGTLKKLKKYHYKPRHIVATYCFPPLPEGNFRNNPLLGGAVLMDLGTYIVTPGRYFFGTSPIAVDAWPTESHDGLITGIRVVMIYEDGRSFVGYYSFESEYQNELKITGRKFFVYLNHCFTTPPDMEVMAKARRENIRCEWIFPPDDAFAAYLRRVMAIKTEEDREVERLRILEDQKNLALIREKLDKRSIDDPSLVIP